MYWYVKLTLYLILFGFVFLVGRCSYRRMVRSRPDSPDGREAAEQVQPEAPEESETVRNELLPGTGVVYEPLPAEAKRLLDAAAAQLRNENLLGARSLARRVFEFDEARMFSPGWTRAAEIISEVNTILVNSDVPAPEKERYQVRSGDALARIARRFGTTVEALQRMNNIDPESSRIYPGMTLDVYRADWSILVSKSNFALLLFDGDELFKLYRVGIGRQDRTPVGTFVVRNKIREPDWMPPGRVIPYGDEENVLGTRWIGLLPVGDPDPALSGYGIHGTWEPDSIGTAASQGCVRMHNDDVDELYDLIPHPRVSEQRLREDPARGVLVTIEE